MNPINVEIRLAEEKDLPHVLEIYAPYITHSKISLEYTVPDLDEFIERYRNITQFFPWIVCLINNEIIGYAYANHAFSRMGYQWDASLTVYIAKEFHKKRIGISLYQCLFEILDLQGMVNLYGIISNDNIGSIHFHEKLGFQTEAVFQNAGYKFGEWVDVTWMVKRIRPISKNPALPRSIHQLDQVEITRVFKKYTELLAASNS